MIVLHGHVLVRVGGYVAVHVVGIAAGAAAGIEALGLVGGGGRIGDVADFIGAGGVGIRQVVNLRKVPAGAGELAALPLQREDVAPHVATSGSDKLRYR